MPSEVKNRVEKPMRGYGGLVKLPRLEIPYRNTQINLVGGLGNQLFGYTAGKFLEQVGGHRVVFNTWHISKGLTNHGATIQGRSLTGDFQSIPPQAKWVRNFRPHYQSRVLGWDPSVATIRTGSQVNGYFQSWKYFDGISDSSISRSSLLKESSGSPWFIDMRQKAEKIEPIILHFRRGDYRKVPEAMGLLGKDYYRDAIDRVPSNLNGHSIWVFSDEPDAAEDFLRFSDQDLTIIKPPENSDPGESLVLMTYGVGHIVSNSTFAWWGAFLSPSSQFVTAPTPWLRGFDDPEYFYPKSWILVDHTWESKE